MTLGARIGQYRRKLGLTQEGLAQRMEVTNQAVSKWESDQSCPDISLLPKLADLFGITMDELFGRETPAKEEPLELPEPETVEEPIVEEIPQYEEPWQKSRTLFEKLFRTTMEKVNQAVEKAEQDLKNVEIHTDHANVREVPVPDDVKLDWEDDETLRVALFLGKRLVEHHPARKKITFCYEGTTPLNIHSECNVSCDGVAGNVTAGGDVSCDSVGGDASAGGDISSDQVYGNVHAMGDVSCDSVLGHVKAGGDVDCDSVHGNVNAGGDVTCENVKGSVNAGGGVTLG